MKLVQRPVTKSWLRWEGSLLSSSAGVATVGLAEAEKQTVMDSTENSLDRTRIVDALKQQWPDHKICDHDRDCRYDKWSYLSSGEPYEPAEEDDDDSKDNAHGE